MVGIVIVCHSNKMVKHLIEFLEMFKSEDFEILNGGDENVSFGTTHDYLKNAVIKADKGNGVLIFADMGSSIDHALSVKKELKDHKIEIANSPVIEGSISAVAGNDKKMTLEKLKLISEEANEFKKVKE